MGDSFMSAFLKAEAMLMLNRSVRAAEPLPALLADQLGCAARRIHFVLHEIRSDLEGDHSALIACVACCASATASFTACPAALIMSDGLS